MARQLQDRNAEATIPAGTIFVVPGEALPRRGRPPLGDRAMTRTERALRSREKKRRGAQLRPTGHDQQPTKPLTRPMRLLALSDIHNNVASVRQLRNQEQNRFDAIAIAGDLGKDCEAEIIRILKTFKCPIIYVYGNWDRYHRTRIRHGARCKLLHLNFTKVGPLTFAGFCFPRWNDCNARYVHSCCAKLVRLLSKTGIDLSSTVFISHAKTSRLVESFPNTLLHLFGHVHTFDVRRRANTTFVNVSAMDRLGRLGNYAVIDIDRSKAISVDCRILPQDNRLAGPSGQTE